MQTLDIIVKGGVVTYADGTTFPLGRKLPMGLGSIEVGPWTALRPLCVRRWSKKGRLQYAADLPEDGLYRITPEETFHVAQRERDTNHPLVRVIRRMLGPEPTVTWVKDGAPVTLGERHYDTGHCPSRVGTNHWNHDGRVAETRTSVLEKPDGAFHGGEYIESVLTGATYAIRQDSGRHLNGAGWTEVTEVALWETCSPETLTDGIARVLWGAGADREYPEAHESLKAAQKWVADRFRFAGREYCSDAAGMVFQFEAQGKPDEFGFHYTPATRGGGIWPNEAVNVLHQKHGIEIFDRLLTPEQRHTIRTEV